MSERPPHIVSALVGIVRSLGCTCDPPGIELAGAVWDREMTPVVAFSHEAGCEIDVAFPLPWFPDELLELLGRTVRGEAQLSILVTAHFGAAATLHGSSPEGRTELLDALLARIPDAHAHALRLLGRQLDVAAIDEACGAAGEIAVVALLLSLDAEGELTVFTQVRAARRGDAAQLAHACEVETGVTLLGYAFASGLYEAARLRLVGLWQREATWPEP